MTKEEAAKTTASATVVNWPALVAGWLVFFVANTQRIDVVPFFNDFREYYQVDYTGVGALLSAYLLGYVIAQIPAGLAADNFPTRRVTVCGLLTITIASGLFAVSANYWLALLLRFLMGISGALLYSSTVKLTLAATPNRGTAMGVLQSGAGAGMIAGTFGLPLIGQFTNLQMAFAAMAVVSLATLAYVAICLAPGAVRKASSESMLGQVSAVARQPQFLLLSSCAFLTLFGSYGVMAWLPTYLRNDFGFSIAAAGGIASLKSVGLMVASPLGGLLSDRLGSRSSVLMTGFAIVAISFALLIVGGSPALIIASSVLSGLGTALTMPIITTLTTEVFGIQRSGVAVSLNLAVGQVASTISGVLFGTLLDMTGSFMVVWVFGFVVAMLGALPALALRKVTTGATLETSKRPA
ncbi:MAG: MFS transporter [Chloroflexi bacterium]|nr:MFS transporter [Chloroflexota bacterium]